ncbi:Myosin-binding protein 7 [Bienertia sinuspersici]
MRDVSVTLFISVDPVLQFLEKESKSKQKRIGYLYMFDLTANDVGLLMLLDNSPRSKLWRCVASTQVRKPELPNLYR